MVASFHLSGEVAFLNLPRVVGDDFRIEKLHALILMPPDYRFRPPDEKESGSRAVAHCPQRGVVSLQQAADRDLSLFEHNLCLLVLD